MKVISFIDAPFNLVFFFDLKQVRLIKGFSSTKNVFLLFQIVLNQIII